MITIWKHGSSKLMHRHRSRQQPLMTESWSTNWSIIFWILSYHLMEFLSNSLYFLLSLKLFIALTLEIHKCNYQNYRLLFHILFIYFLYFKSVRWNKVPSVENLGNFELLIDEELATQQTQDDNLLTSNLASGKTSRVNNRWK